MILPATTQRVSTNTSDIANRRIKEQTQANIEAHRLDSPERLERRLSELEHEWDIERTLEANAASAVLIGVGLGAFVDRRFFAIPGIVAGFLLQHALQGWCPPLPLFRAFGVRTQSEIDQEIYALKALRGDFQSLGHSKHTTVALDAVRK
jgi:F0F1-type ATP synthase assembly protein I